MQAIPARRAIELATFNLVRDQFDAAEVKLRAAKGLHKLAGNHFVDPPKDRTKVIGRPILFLHKISMVLWRSKKRLPLIADTKANLRHFLTMLNRNQSSS